MVSVQRNIHAKINIESKTFKLTLCKKQGVATSRSLWCLYIYTSWETNL